MNIDSVLDECYDMMGKPIYDGKYAINLPVDIYTTNDQMVIEIAAVGKTKDQIHIKNFNSEYVDLYNCLHINIDKSNILNDNRSYVYHKIKQDNIDFNVYVPFTFDISKENTTVSLKNGLVTIIFKKKTPDQLKEQEYSIN
jgi:HSP20 family molecular chaperone IbpA